MRQCHGTMGLVIHAGEAGHMLDASVDDWRMSRVLLLSSLGPIPVQQPQAINIASRDVIQQTKVSVNI